jgi:DNA-binding CsgD family transcriptional regulator
MNARVKNRGVQKRLSRREQQVMQLIADGKTTPEIAKQFGLSLKTIQAHVAHIKAKLRLENMSQVIRLAAISFRPGTANHFRELLNCAEKIEVRFFDRRGKLIATRHFSADSSHGRRVRKRQQ